MHKADVAMLSILYKNECVSQLKSYTIKQLLEKLSRNDTGAYKYTMIHNTLKALEVAEYVSKGLKNSRADTYYITRRGVDKLKDLSSV